MGFAEEKHFSILDYCEASTVFICNYPQFNEAARMITEEATDYFSEMFEEGQMMSHLAMYQDPMRILTHFSPVIHGHELIEKANDTAFVVRPIIGSANNLANFGDTISASFVPIKLSIVVLLNKAKRSLHNLYIPCISL